MTIAVTTRARCVSLAASLALVTSFLGPVASADDGQTGVGTPPSNDAVSTPPPPPAADLSNQLLGPIERLPLSGYPSEPVRGIPQGSLKLTMQGLQFPYYPQTGIAVSGYTWIDTGYEQITRGNPNEQSIKYFVQQGRLVLRVTPTLSDGHWFAQTQAEFVADEDQSQSPPLIATVDDLWIKAGRWKVFDVQVGRFEAWEVYHFGMGLDLYTLERNGATDQTLSVPEIYGLTYAFYRPLSAGAAAVHLYPTSFLRFELGARFGDEAGQNLYGFRPVGVLDLGIVKVKAGAEYVDSKPQAEGVEGELKEQGVGAGVQLILAPYVEGGINAAYGQTRLTNNQGNLDGPGSFDTASLGVFANVRIVENLLAGGGVNYTYLQDEQFDAKLGRDQNFDHWQAFGAIQYVLWNRLYIKDVVGYALADFNVNNGALPFANKMISERLRVEYLF
jgi:hypothetical protein